MIKRGDEIVGYYLRGLSMVPDHGHIRWAGIGPSKNDTPLIVDADGVEA
jgi:hypothetical protein